MTQKPLNKKQMQRVRSAKTEKEFFEAYQSQKTLKDVDFIQINDRVKKLQQLAANQCDDSINYQPNGLIRISEYNEKRIGRMIQKDAEFLERHGLMDYSLFMVVEHLSESD